MNIGLALGICKELEIFDTKKQKMVFKFVNIYPYSKMLKIVEKAKSYPWWSKNSVAAFMKAVGEINKEEKVINGQPSS